MPKSTDTTPSGTVAAETAATSRADAEQTLRVGVIGCGYWGPNIIRNFASIENCELRTICDADEDRLDAIQRRYPAVSVETDAAALMDGSLDAVAICTPIRFHYPMAKAALEAGMHVFVEKPMTDSSATARELVELAADKKRALMVDHTFVYSGPVRKIRSIIDDGQLGDLLYFDSVRINLGLFQQDANVVWDLAPHDVSIMDYLLQREPKGVSAIGSVHFGDQEDMAYMTVRFDGPLLAHFHVNWLAPVKIRKTVIGGSQQMIVYDDLEPTDRVKVYDKGVSVNVDDSERRRVLIDYRTGDMFAPKIDKTEPLFAACSHFADCALNGNTPLTDGEAGLRVVRILEAAQESIAKSGAEVTL